MGMEVEDALALEDLDGEAAAGVDVASELDFGKVALPKRPPHLVLAHPHHLPLPLHRYIFRCTTARGRCKRRQCFFLGGRGEEETRKFSFGGAGPIGGRSARG